MTASRKPDVIVHDKLYINGEWIEPAGSGLLEVTNSTTEEVMGRIPEGTAEDVNRAVAAARAAFNSWSATSVDERARLLKRDLRKAGRAPERDRRQSLPAEVGMPLPLATAVQAGLPAMVMGSFAKLVAEYHLKSRSATRSS